MMPLNPNIAMGVRGIELQNPLAQYGQIAQIQNAQNQNALAQYQLGSAERQDVAQNALNEAYAKNIDPKTGEINFAGVRNFLAGKGAGSQIPGQLKLEREATTAKLAQQKTETELVDAKLKQSRQFLDTLDPVANPVEAAQQYLSWHEANHRDPILGPALTARGIDPANSRAGIMAAIQKGPQALADAINASKLGNEKFMELNKPSNITVNQGGQTQILQKAGLGGPLTSAGIYADVPLPALVEEQKKRIAKAGASNINLPAQEKAFEGELGKGQAEDLIKSRAAARDAASIIDTVKTGRDIMGSGMITGAGADFLVNLNQGLKTAGIDSGYADAAANSQAFTANMAGNVGKLIKQFGAGTGLSDADREFAKDMAGGRISLDAKAINKILDINERAARNVITRHNKDVKGIKTNIPLEVELPPETKTPAAKNVVTNPQFPGFSIGKP
jgi:hypothetical protein